MTAIDSAKLRELVQRMHRNSLEMQQANKDLNLNYCIGWRGATNTYAIALMELIDREAAAQAQPTEIPVQETTCIDCGQPCPPDRDPLRCLVCQLDKDVGTDALTFTPTAGGVIIGARRKDPEQ